MIGQQQKFSGNILLYDYLAAKRAPVFLNRNLTRSLRLHRRWLEEGTLRGFAGSNHDLRSLWQPPTWDALDEMMEHENSKGCFVLDVHALKAITSSANGVSPGQVQPVRKARKLSQVKSTVNVTIHSSIEGHPCWIEPGQKAVFQNTVKTSERAVTVTTKRVRINPNNFSHSVPHQRTESAYKMSISINFDTLDAAEDFYNYLEPKRISSQDIETRLSTTVSDILQCPTGKVILPLRHANGDLNIGLEVSMYWTSPAGDSILSTHNRHTNALARPPSIITPPTPAPDSNRPIKLVFVYGDKTVTRHALVCPQDSCKKHPRDIDELRFHLNGVHDYFKFEAPIQKADDSGYDTWVIKTHVSYHTNLGAHGQRASDRADEPFDIRMIPPTTAFDASRYLDDDDDEWQRKARLSKPSTIARNATTAPMHAVGPPKRKLPSEVSNRPMRKKIQYPVPPAPSGVTFFRSASKRPLREGEYISESDDEVDDVWIKQRKSAEFDKESSIPDSFKRFLKIFDLHMWKEQLQSDLHVGDALIRFTRENCDRIWEEQIFEPFKEKVEQLLEDNIISEEVHVGCLDIVETAKPIPVEEGNDISQQLADLVVRHSSHDSLYEDPLPLRGPGREAHSTATSASKKKKVDKGKGKARVTETGHLTPITADSDGDLEMREATLGTEIASRANKHQHTQVSPPYDLCVCGQDAQSSTRKAPMIACSNMNCTRRSFHYDCIKDRWRITQEVRALRRSGWTCNDCRPTSATGK